MTRQPSRFTRLVTAAARRIANDPVVPPERRAALEATVEHVIWAQWREIFGGDTVRMRAPDVEPRERQARTSRISSALQAGESIAGIARREQLHKQSVRRILAGARDNK